MGRIRVAAAFILVGAVGVGLMTAAPASAVSSPLPMALRTTSAPAEDPPNNQGSLTPEECQAVAAAGRADVAATAKEKAAPYRAAYRADVAAAKAKWKASRKTDAARARYEMSLRLAKEVRNLYVGLVMETLKGYLRAYDEVVETCISSGVWDNQTVIDVSDWK